MLTEAQDSAYKSGLVRFFQGNNAIGAGFYVGNGYVLTCAHVVSQALGLGKKSQAVLAEAVAGKPLKLDSPFVAREQLQSAEIVSSLWRLNDEDLAVLQVLEADPAGVTPLPVKESSSYWEHVYHVFGFPDGHPNGVWTQGKFLDEQIKGWVQMEDTKTQGLAIEPGFSGAPVWDETAGAVVGMTVAHDEDREAAKVGFMIPHQKLRRALKAIALFELLLPHSERLAPHWPKAYRLLRSDLSREDNPTTLEAAILQVLDMPNRGSDYQPIQQFIGYFALPEWQLELQVRLVQWLTQQEIDAQALINAIRQKLQTQPPIPIAPHLLFWVQGESESDRYFVQAYLVKDRERYDPLTAHQLKAPAEWLESSKDEKVDCAQIEQILRGCLEECVEQLTHGEDLPNIQLEVFLPPVCLEKKGWEVDRWAADEPDPLFSPDPEPIGSRYSVVLRSAVRLLDPRLLKPQIKGLWHNKWTTLTQNQANPAHQRLVSGDHETPQTLQQKLRPSQVVGFFLTRSQPNLFPVLCGTGAPVAIWLRQELPDQCQQQFNQLLTCNLADLPASIRELRTRLDDQCHAAELHLKQHLSIIWEDPKLVPPLPRTVLRMPG